MGAWGPKGQIVISKEAREMFGIEPGAFLLLLLADEKKGIAIVRQEPFSEVHRRRHAGHPGRWLGRLCAGS
ncbi:hypothetical protein JD82_04555 [Prauserella rugosa]|uniref:SpoVT-AbrB domain-containing protein n=1 Tax=Prauserella rugosa TaxID=43354 RepID=A0A660CNG4_9PSEU|nr:AbrB/MazE/SpoVT family DNA-binding domain-containing protein [Prauserella rugosa]TWH22665.1 hypothetical protein JD82_04555 [Prauserella rugosa]